MISATSQMRPQILLSAIVEASKNQVSSDLAGEAVILDLKTGVYYGLNPVGACIWNLIQQPRRVVEVCESILEDYDVDPARCENDILQLLGELAVRGLIEIRYEKDDQVPSPPFI